MSIAEIVLLFTGILVLYTIGLVLCRKYQYVNAVVLIGFGVMADWWGTWQMYGMSDNFSWNLHSIFGITAIILVTASAVVGLVSILFHSYKMTTVFHRSLPWAYGAWVLSYLNGFMSYGA